MFQETIKEKINRFRSAQIWKRKTPASYVTAPAANQTPGAKTASPKGNQMKYVDPFSASYFPFCFTSLEGATGCTPGEFKYSDQLWFEAQLEQILRAGQTVEELYFAMSEYFGNVYKTISQMNNWTIQERTMNNENNSGTDTI